MGWPAACYLTYLGSPTSSKQALSFQPLFWLMRLAVCLGPFSSPEPVVSCRYKSSRVALGKRIVWGIQGTKMHSAYEWICLQSSCISRQPETQKIMDHEKGLVLHHVSLADNYNLDKTGDFLTQLHLATGLTEDQVRVVTWYIRDPLIPIFLPLFWSLSPIFPKILIPEPW